MASNTAPATVKSAMRTLDILEFLVGQNRPLAAHELAAALGIPVSSLSYLLGTLVERGYVERSGRLYVPGAGLARLQPGTRPMLAERVAPLVRALRTQLNETAGFFVRRGFEVEAIASEIGEHVLRYTLHVGQTGPMHSLSAGKALLATLSEEELDRYFREVERTAFTANTMVEETTLRDEIETIRVMGIAHTSEEQTPGIVGIGRAATIDGEVVGAFSVAMPAARFSADVDRNIVRALTRATELLAGS